MRAVLFDLDDTLYDEQQFVLSGLQAVVATFSHRLGVEPAEFMYCLVRTLKTGGRQRLFDRVLVYMGLYDRALVSDMVEVYRGHTPNITLFPEAEIELQRLKERGYRLGLVTDGLPAVQRAKVYALGLERLMDVLVFTWSLGETCSKPSPEGYLFALRSLNIPPQQAVYVGDNEAKDFRGANQLGILTVRVRPPAWGLAAAHVAASPDDAPKERIDSLKQLESVLAKYEQAHRPCL